MSRLTGRDIILVVLFSVLMVPVFATGTILLRTGTDSRGEAAVTGLWIGLGTAALVPVAAWLMRRYLLAASTTLDAQQLRAAMRATHSGPVPQDAAARETAILRVRQSLGLYRRFRYVMLWCPGLFLPVAVGRALEYPGWWLNVALFSTVLGGGIRNFLHLRRRLALLTADQPTGPTESAL